MIALTSGSELRALADAAGVAGCCELEHPARSKPETETQTNDRRCRG